MVAKGVGKGIETGIEAGRLYKEGASRFPNEDAPHSEAVKQLEEAGKK